jgi:hypothetical protein
MHKLILAILIVVAVGGCEDITGNYKFKKDDLVVVNGGWHKGDKCRVIDYDVGLYWVVCQGENGVAHYPPENLDKITNDQW